MQTLKFLFGILLAQGATYILILLSPNVVDMMTLLRILFPLFFIALSLSFWFSSMAKQHNQESFSSQKEKLHKQNQKDKERILKEATKAKEKFLKEAQRDMSMQSAKTTAKANFKVGAAFAGALGVGALFVFAQMVTAGLLALAATGGAMGGYYIRSKRAQREKLYQLNSPTDVEVIPQIKEEKQ